MTRDEIIKLAREACDPGKVDAWQNGFWVLTQEELERFAAAYAAAALTKTTSNAWQDAVQDRLVNVHGLTDENANDPRKAIADLIRIETQIALDPAVSSDAHALIAAGAAAERERIEAGRQPHIYSQPIYTNGCPVCGMGANGRATGVVCNRGDCPTRVTCTGAV